MNKILVIDDDKCIQLLYSEELTDEGYEVILCDDGGGPMDLVLDRKPDLIVMDIYAGNHNGPELFQRIRNTFSRLPIILCSAYYAFEQNMKSFSADYCVIKSTDHLGELKLKIRLALEKVLI